MFIYSIFKIVGKIIEVVFEGNIKFNKNNIMDFIILIIFDIIIYYVVFLEYSSLGILKY